MNIMDPEEEATFMETKPTVEYLQELLNDRTTLCYHSGFYMHVENVLEKEIFRVRAALFSSYGIFKIGDSDLPKAEGQTITLQDKVYMPTDSPNSFNFVGRLLGPDGSTAKYLQQCLGTKIMVRGRGSMRDRRKEESNIGKPHWEHLNEDLHVLLTVEDTENRAKARLAKAREYITMFLRESMKGSDKEDKVKQMQLMELASRREHKHAHWLCNNLIGSPELLFNPKLINSLAWASNPTAALANNGLSASSGSPAHLTQPIYPHYPQHYPVSPLHLQSESSLPPFPPLIPPAATAAAAAAAAAAMLSGSGSTAGLTQGGLHLNAMTAPPSAHPTALALAAMNYLHFLNGQSNGFVGSIQPPPHSLSSTFGSFDHHGHTIAMHQRAPLSGPPTSVSEFPTQMTSHFNFPSLMLPAHTNHQQPAHQQTFVSEEQQQSQRHQLSDTGLIAAGNSLRPNSMHPSLSTDQISPAQANYPGLYASAALPGAGLPLPSSSQPMIGLTSNQSTSIPTIVSCPDSLTLTNTQQAQAQKQQHQHLSVSPQQSQQQTTGQRRQRYSQKHHSHQHQHNHNSQSAASNEQFSRHTNGSLSGIGIVAESGEPSQTDLKETKAEFEHGNQLTDLPRKPLPGLQTQRPIAPNLAGVQKNGKNGRYPQRVHNQREVAWTSDANETRDLVSKKAQASMNKLTKPILALDPKVSVTSSCVADGSSPSPESLVSQSNGM